MPRPLIVMVVLLVASACSPAGSAITASPTSAPPTAAPPTAATAAPATPAAGATVSVASAGYFVGPNGMTLYTFDEDSPDTSACSGDCLANWPALTVPAANDIIVGAGLDSSAFATITRTDGPLQVTFNHVPLYYFAGDSAPGDTTGDGVGGVWHLATASSASPSQPPPPAASPYSNDPAYLLNSLPHRDLPLRVAACASRASVVPARPRLTVVSEMASATARAWVGVATGW